jgi:hypothetical protein
LRQRMTPFIVRGRRRQCTQPIDRLGRDLPPKSGPVFMLGFRHNLDH